MKSSIAALVLLAAAGMAHAQTPSLMKAGLWDITVSKMVYDGNDMTAMIASAQAQLAKLPPDQRAMAESRFKMAGSGVQMCISEAMLAKHQFGGDSHCPSTKTDISGNKMSFSVNCTYEGRTTTGSGQWVVNGDSVSTHLDAKVTDAKGTHTILAESVMHYGGADCKGLKPADQK
jgi:hypothetical protein